MPKKSVSSEAASALAKKRWKGKTQAQKTAAASDAASARWKDATVETKKAAASVAAKARWAKAKKKKGPPAKASEP